MTIEIAFPLRDPIPGDVVLDEDQRVVAVREIQEMISGLGHLHSFLKQEFTVSKDLTRSVLQIAEGRMMDLCKITGIEIESIKEREERFSRIRLLNARVRELEAELGKSGSVEQTTEHIKSIAKILDRWWDVEGFAHISDMRFTKWGNLEVGFSCALFGEFNFTQSKTPVSDKSRKIIWHESLTQRGFKLGEEPGERDPVLIDCDQNRAVLQTLFKSALPSSSIVESTNHNNVRAGFSVLRSIRVFIRDLNDVIGLEQRLREIESPKM